MSVFTKCAKYLGISRDVIINQRLRGCYRRPELSHNLTGIYNFRFTAERMEQGKNKRLERCTAKRLD